MLSDGSRSNPKPRISAQQIQCEECTIQIGDGYQESISFEFVDDEASVASTLRVCWRCWESLARRRSRRLEAAVEQAPR